MLGVREVVVPPHPGITSAIGLLTTDLKYGLVRTAFLVSTNVDLARMNADLAAMEPRCAHSCRPTTSIRRRRRSSAQRMRATSARVTSCAAAAGVDLGQPELDAALARFHELHAQEYGHHFERSPIELVNLRVTAVGQVPKIRVPPPPAQGSVAEARLRIDDVAFRGAQGLESCRTVVYDRSRLPVGESIAGRRSCCSVTRPRSCRRRARSKYIHPVPC
jgi:N-methylhydantoinase A